MLGKVLLVEDNADDERLALRSLARCGVKIEVIVARDGEAALEAIQELDQDPEVGCLVLLDLKLPRVNGLEVLQKIRARESGYYLPVVMLTSSAELEDVRASYKFGANCYLQKPVDYAAYVALLDKAMQFWFCDVRLPVRLRDKV